MFFAWTLFCRHFHLLSEAKNLLLRSTYCLCPASPRTFLQLFRHADQRLRSSPVIDRLRPGTVIVFTPEY